MKSCGSIVKIGKSKVKEIPEWSKVHSILFDFDGVFTDNKVNVSEEGVEHVTCSRADGLE